MPTFDAYLAVDIVFCRRQVGLVIRLINNHHISILVVTAGVPVDDLSLVAGMLNLLLNGQRLSFWATLYGQLAFLYAADPLPLIR